MDNILQRSNLTPQEKLTGLAALQGMLEKIKSHAGVLFFSSSVAPTPPVKATLPLQPPNARKASDKE